MVNLFDILSHRLLTKSFQRVPDNLYINKLQENIPENLGTFKDRSKGFTTSRVRCPALANQDRTVPGSRSRHLQAQFSAFLMLSNCRPLLQLSLHPKTWGKPNHDSGFLISPYITAVFCLFTKLFSDLVKVPTSNYDCFVSTSS